MLRSIRGRLKPKMPADSDGFTLIELMVTVFVIGVVVVSLGGLFYIMQVDQVRSQRYDLAVQAARSEVEVLRNSGYGSLTPNTTIYFTSSLPAGLPKGATGSVYISEPASDPDLRQVDVTVAYTDYGYYNENVTLSSDIGIIGLGEDQ